MMLPITKTHVVGHNTGRRKPSDPMAAITEADCATRQRPCVTIQSTSGVSSIPKLLPAAMAALAVAPAWKCFIAITSRKVRPAVSTMPEVAARMRS